MQPCRPKLYAPSWSGFDEADMVYTMSVKEIPDLGVFRICGLDPKNVEIRKIKKKIGRTLLRRKEKTKDDE